jgi:outer membrane receptor protein involved in Fe transport
MKLKTLSIITVITLMQCTTFAQEVSLDPVVVSSDFREQSLSQTAGSVAVIAEEEIAQRVYEPFENLISEVPNVNFTSGASRAHYIQIRGIGERSQFATPVNPSVGIMIDGIDFSQSALGITLFDVKQMEVLRGPQGTTFGANGLAGVLNIESNAPSKETQAHAEVTLGNYNQQSAGIAVGGTLLKDRLLGRFSVYKNTSDGFIENSYLHRSDTNNIDELTLKGALKWLVNDDLTLDLNLIHLDVDNGYDAFTLDNSRTSHADEPGTDAQKTDAFSLKANYQLSTKFHLEGSVSASQSDLEYGYDEDWSYKGEFEDTLYPYSSKDQYLRDRDQIDFDLRVISDETGKIFSNSTAWTIGAYYKEFSEDLTRNYTYLEAPYSSDYETENRALYGQLDSALNSKLTLITGLRVESWEAKFSDSDKVQIDTDETLVGGKIGIKYQQDKNRLLYATLSKGYKPGGVNADNSLSLAQRDYDTETLWNIDIGATSTHLDGQVTSRVNLFYGKREDQQVKSSVVQVRDDGSTKYTDYLTNAAKGHNYGLEYELDAYLDSLHLFTDIGLLQAKFDEYVDPNPDALDVNGRAPAQSPSYQYNVGFDYAFGDSFLFSSNVEGKGSYYFSNRHDAKADAYTLLNSSLSTTNGNWTATLWGRNLTDADYQVRGFGSFGNNPAKGYATEVYTQQGAPRTFGLTVSYDY